MMSELRDLYQEVILDHSKRPRNFRALPAANRQRRGLQPALRRPRDRLPRPRGRRAEGRRLRGRGLRDLDGVGVDDDREPEGQDARGGGGPLRALPRPDHRSGRSAAAGRELGKLEVFSGVREFPVRVKCATLPWHTLKAALAGRRRDGLDRVRRAGWPRAEEPDHADAQRSHRRARRRRPGRSRAERRSRCTPETRSSSRSRSAAATRS